MGLTRLTRAGEKRTCDIRTGRLWWLAGILAAAASLGCGTEPSNAPATQIRSVLLITIDTLRADHLSGYGYVRPTSPQLDRFMDRGQRFRWAFSTSSRTAPSHVSIFTGLYPSATTVSVENGKYPLDAQTPTLASLAQRAGVRTAAIVSNAVLNRRLGLDRGFEVYDDVLPEQERNRFHRERIAEDAVAAALLQLEEFGSERFFLWLHLQDPHGPYTPPQAAIEALADASDSADEPAPATRLERGRITPATARSRVTSISKTGISWLITSASTMRRSAIWTNPWVACSGISKRKGGCATRSSPSRRITAKPSERTATSALTDTGSESIRRGFPSHL